MDMCRDLFSAPSSSHAQRALHFPTYILDYLTLPSNDALSTQRAFTWHPHAWACGVQKMSAIKDLKKQQ